MRNDSHVDVLISIYDLKSERKFEENTYRC